MRVGRKVLNLLNYVIRFKSENLKKVSLCISSYPKNAL